MSYTRESPIRGTGTVSAAAIQAWFVSRGPAYKGFAPNGQYEPPPDDLGAAIVAECRRYPDQVVNHDLIAAQILHETAAWQSEYARERNNPGGIGAVNDNPDLALWFATPAEGVRAHVAHMLNYVFGRGPWSVNDPRGLPDGYYGVVDVLKDLEQRWAWTPPQKYAATPPDQRYGGQLAKHANALVSFANDGSWGPPMALTPPAGWKPPQIINRVLPWGASNTPGQKLRGGSWDYLTVHNTGNPNPGANAIMHARYLEGLAAAGAGEPSWHYTVDDTQIAKHLEDDWAGYHASDGTGDGNFDSLGFELCEIGDQERVLWNAGWLMAQKIKERGKTIEVMRQHHDWARDKKNCPRLLRANNGAGWKRLLAIIGYFLNSEPQLPDDDRILVEGNPFGPFGYRLGFKGRLQQIGAAVNPTNIDLGILAWAGWAMEDEYTATDGCAYQRTERLILKYTPGVAVPFDVSPMLRSETPPKRRDA